jgi:hypothetical protein
LGRRRIPPRTWNPIHNWDKNEVRTLLRCVPACPCSSCVRTAIWINLLLLISGMYYTYCRCHGEGA